MLISIIGDNETAKSTRALLRHAGFAVSATPQRARVRIWIEESAKSPQIYFDSIDAPLEAAVLRHVSQLSHHPIVIDRPGGHVHADNELRLSVPMDDFDQQHAVQLGVLRGLLDFTGAGNRPPRWRRFLARLRASKVFVVAQHAAPFRTFDS